MRLSMRFIVPLVLALAAIAYAVVPLVDGLMLRWFERDLDSRSGLIANSVRLPLREAMQTGNRATMVQSVNEIARNERLYAVGFCGSPSSEAIATASLPREIRCSRLDSIAANPVSPSGAAGGPLFVSVVPMVVTDSGSGSLVLVHDMSFMAQRSEETRKYLFYFFVALGVAVSLITVIIAQISWRGWVAGLQALMQGEGLWRRSEVSDRPEFRPIARDLRTLIADIEAESRAGDHDRVNWNAEVLRNVLHADLRGQEVIVVSNREPYIHDYAANRDGIIVRRPASGLVTALEPIMRACSGTWIAHGGGSADRAVVDHHDRVGVPPREAGIPAAPRLAHTRKRSRATTTALRTRGSGRSATSRTCARFPHRRLGAVREGQPEVRERGCARNRSRRIPIVLVQDYHFALLPRMIRDAMPAATIITFWHIPWPNPEAFGSARGAKRCSTACSAAASSASTRSSTATISSTRSTASSKRAATGRHSR